MHPRRDKARAESLTQQPSPSATLQAAPLVQLHPAKGRCAAEAAATSEPGSLCSHENTAREFRKTASKLNLGQNCFDSGQNDILKMIQATWGREKEQCRFCPSLVQAGT